MVTLFHGEDNFPLLFWYTLTKPPELQEISVNLLNVVFYSVKQSINETIWRWEYCYCSWAMHVLCNLLIILCQLSACRQNLDRYLAHWQLLCCLCHMLTHWGRVTHICVGKLTIIGSDNGLSPGRRQAIIWTNAGILLIGPLGTNFSDILTEIITFSFKKMYLKVSSAIWRLFCLDLNVLTIMGSVKGGPLDIQP